MKAAVVAKYGPPEVLRVVEARKPVPGRGRVQIRVVATAVTAGDARIRSARFPAGFAGFARLAFGVRRPRRPILGMCLSGVVEQVGEGVSRFSPGDEVAGMAGAALGAHAEYVVVPAEKVVRKPAPVSHDEAAAILFGGTTALYFLRDRAHLHPGASVLVNGASGAVGTAAVQLARHLGGTVTAVCSARNADLVAGLGADRVIDYATTPVSALTDRFDVVLDVVGNLSATSGKRLLADGGVLCLAVAGLGDTLRARGPVVAGSAPEHADDMGLVLSLVEVGRLTVVHEVVGGLDDLPEAYRRVDSGHKVGSVVVRP